MPLRGAPIGQDAVLVWTGDRELTRFERGGQRTSFTIPIHPIGARIGPAGVRVVDHAGTIHRYSLAGVHDGALPLHALREGVVIAAALASTGNRMIAIVRVHRDGEDFDAAELFEEGAATSWCDPTMREGRRDLDVDLSDDGERVLVRYKTSYYFTGYGSGGSRGYGACVVGIDGIALHDEWDSAPLDVAAMSPDGAWLATTERWGTRGAVYVRHGDAQWLVSVYEDGPSIAFGARHVAVLSQQPSQVAVVELATRREAQLALPEQFTEVVFCGDHIVAVHPELGAWWIPLASLAFTAPEA